MEKYLAMVSDSGRNKSGELGLQSSAEIIKSWTSLKKDTIKVDESGQMHVLKTQGMAIAYSDLLGLQLQVWIVMKTKRSSDKWQWKRLKITFLLKE